MSAPDQSASPSWRIAGHPDLFATEDEAVARAWELTPPGKQRRQVTLAKSWSDLLAESEPGPKPPR